MFTRGGAFLLLRNASAVVSAPNAPHRLRFALKGIRDISMWDELPPITSLQRWCDIVATLAHYYNVMGDMVRMLCIRRNSTAGIRSPQMSWLIRRSIIKVIELRLPVRGDAGSSVGGWPEGGTYNPFSLYSSTSSDISTSCTPANSWSHTAGRISASLSASDFRI